MSVWCEVCAARENQPEVPGLGTVISIPSAKSTGKLEAPAAPCSVATARTTNRKPIDGQWLHANRGPNPCGSRGWGRFLAWGSSLASKRQWLAPINPGTRPTAGRGFPGKLSLRPTVNAGSPRWLVSALLRQAIHESSMLDPRWSCSRTPSLSRVWESYKPLAVFRGYRNQVGLVTASH